jgi:hypothetical protein
MRSDQQIGLTAAQGALGLVGLPGSERAFADADDGIAREIADDILE